MKVLVIGGGAREHTLGWRLKMCPSVEQVFVAPGNAGMRGLECLPMTATKPEDYLQLAELIEADLTVVGPEAPLVDGVVDLFESRGRAIVGPRKAAAAIEGSKIFAKELMDEAGVPTARFVVADSLEQGLAALSRFEYPVVLKADGLAAGKGVVIAKTGDAARETMRQMFSGDLVGAAGARVVIEDFEPGEEVSFMVLTDGRSLITLPPSQDHKAVYDNDQGPNTGGMGAYSMDEILTPQQTQQMIETVITPTLRAMAQRGTPYRGFLYAGLMMTPRGVKVLEFNARLGDPETQVLLTRIEGDFALVLKAAAEGRLDQVKLTWSRNPAATVVMAAEGYPGKVRTGIHGIDAAESLGARVFCAGVKAGQGSLVTAGGRVLSVTAVGDSLESALRTAYAGASQVRFDGMHYRSDIGQKGIRKLRNATMADMGT